MDDREDLLKIGELAKRTGVSTATIRFYIREGLLPRPTVKTSRNMAYYDESFVARIRFVRRLQDERRLPLASIRTIVAGDDGKADGVPSLVELEAKAAAAVEAERVGEPVDEATLVERTGVTREDLDDLEALGLIARRPGPRGRGARGGSLGPLDVAIVESVGRARALGLSRELFPATDLRMYLDALSTLVPQELALFAQRTQGRALPLASDKLIEGAVHTMGELLRHLRKKLIVELLSSSEPPPKPRPKSKRARR